MTVTDVRKDPDALTLTITASFGAPIERVWQIWEDPRQLERWWGPPTYPATVVRHELHAGGRVTYFMTGPGGDRHHGWWAVRAVEPPHTLEFEDGFADEQGRADRQQGLQRAHCAAADVDKVCARLFHGIRPRMRAMPQKPVTPANSRPAPTKPERA